MISLNQKTQLPLLGLTFKIPLLTLHTLNVSLSKLTFQIHRLKITDLLPKLSCLELFQKLACLLRARGSSQCHITVFELLLHNPCGAASPCLHNVMAGLFLQSHGNRFSALTCFHSSSRRRIRCLPALKALFCCAECV